ncbi:MAG: sugar ABC transporter permease [Fimbriimonadia bacterium]|jgi:multiple sugar transport system permease protein
MGERPNWRGYLFILPAFAHLVVFALIPIVYAAILSLHRWNILKEGKPFVGLGNYLFLFQDAEFWNAVWNSARFALMSVPLGMLVALAVAILVNQKLRGVTLFRTIFYVPAISSGVAISMVWIWIYLPRNGLINFIAQLFGFSGTTDFLNDPTLAMPALVFMSIWVGLGPRMVLFIAGLAAIPQSFYEAAQVDGATRWSSFRHVTIPLLLPTTFFVLVTSTIAALQVFTPVYMMTKGGPLQTTDVVGYHIYNQAWRQFEMGMASAQSYILFALVLGITLLQFKFLSKRLQGFSIE